MTTCSHRGCTRPATPGYRSCEPCRTQTRVRNKRLVIRLVDEGRCTRCGDALSAEERRDERTRCAKCRAAELVRNRQVRARGPRPLRVVGCSRCGEPGHYAKTCTAAPRKERAA